MQEDETGFIKIGYTTHPIETRLQGLQNGNPRKLSVVFIMPGSLWDETALHRQFKHLNIHLEWFRPGADLLEHIAQLQKESNAA